ncbi:MAG: S8 family serine peptidase [candidate division WOR-3 bacterium]
MRYIIGAMIGVPLMAGTIMPSLEKVMNESEPGERIAILVHLKDKPVFRINKTTAEKAAYIDYLKDFCSKSQAPVISFAEGIGVQKIQSYWVFNGFYAEATPEQIRSLAERPEIEYIIEDFVITLPKDEVITPADGSKAVAWGVDTIQADRVWTELGFTGAGIVVANMDTGVDVSHPAFGGRWRSDNGWYDAVNGQPNPYDDHGHGTHTMGTICGGDGPGPFAQDIGVAPGATFIATKCFNSSGSGQNSWIHNSFQWIANLASSGKEPDLVSNSWGSTSTTSLEYWNDVQTWRSLDIHPIFSIGNNGYGNPGTAGTPGNFPLVIGVGATNSSDILADFSSLGPAPNQNPWNDPANWLRSDWNLIKPDISAPGVSVYSALPGGGYGTMDGTSMACPHVAGTVALMLEKNSTLDIYTIYDILLNTAVWKGHMGTRPNNNYGWGRVNAYDAVSNVPGTNMPNVVIQSTALSEPSGNGLWDPNEQVSFVVTLRNTGISVQNVNATLSGSDSYVSLLDSVASYGDIAQGQSKDNASDPYDAFASSSTPCGYNKNFNMHITGTNPAYSVDRSLSFTIGVAPGQQFNSFDGPSSGDYYLYGAAFDGNNLWVVYFLGTSLYKLNPDNGSLRGTITAPNDSITDIAWDPTRKCLWLHDCSRKMIYRIDTLGNLQGSFSSPATTYPTGLTYDPVQDILYVADRDNYMIYKVNPNTGATISSHNVNFGGQYGPRCLAVEPRGSGGSGTLIFMYTFFNAGGTLDSTVLYELSKTNCSRTGKSYNFGAANLRGIEYDSRKGLYWITYMQDDIIAEIGGFYCESGTGVVGQKPFIPLTIEGPWPSVCRGDYSLLLALPTDALVRVSAYDITGRLVERVFTGKLGSGIHTLNVSTNLGSGVYILRAEIGNESFIRKLIIEK